MNDRIPPQIVDPERRLVLGDMYPYDAPDAWWLVSDADGAWTREGDDWAHRAARGVVADLTDRRGIKRGFEDIDEDVRTEIVNSLAAIIRLAKELDEKGAT